MTVASALLSSARRYRDVTGRQLARDTDSSQAGLVQLEHGTKDATTDRLDKVLRALDYQLAILPTRLGTAAAAAEDVRGFVAAGRRDACLRVVLQLAADLAAADPALRVALTVVPPAPTGDARFDALIAAVVDHTLTKDGLPHPTWVAEPTRALDEPWDVEPVPALRGAARRRTPRAIQRHGVFLDPAELVDG